MSDWKPIEAAPYDGSPILGCNKKHEMAVVYWDADVTNWGKTAEGEWRITGYGAWWLQAACDCGKAQYWTPTHWMPLPELPK